LSVLLQSGTRVLLKSLWKQEQRTAQSSSPPASDGTEETVTVIINEQQMLSILNDLFAIETFSLANYLRYAPPWSKPEEEPLRNVIRHIADNQQHDSAQLRQ